MVRTLVTPDHANIELAIPQSYVGKQLEVLVYTVDEVETQPAISNLTEPKKASDFRGTLSAERAELYLNHIKESREGWQKRT